MLEGNSFDNDLKRGSIISFLESSSLTDVRTLGLRSDLLEYPGKPPTSGLVHIGVFLDDHRPIFPYFEGVNSTYADLLKVAPTLYLPSNITRLYAEPSSTRELQRKAKTSFMSTSSPIAILTFGRFKDKTPTPEVLDENNQPIIINDEREKYKGEAAWLRWIQQFDPGLALEDIKKNIGSLLVQAAA